MVSLIFLLCCHHIFGLEHFLHELLLLIHDLKVLAIYLFAMLIYIFLWYTQGLLHALKDVLIAPETIHGKDLSIGLLCRRLHVGVQSNYVGRAICTHSQD